MMPMQTLTIRSSKTVGMPSPLSERDGWYAQPVALGILVGGRSGTMTVMAVVVVDERDMIENKVASSNVWPAREASRLPRVLLDLHTDVVTCGSSG